jgi:thymidylate synthase
MRQTMIDAECFSSLYRSVIELVTSAGVPASPRGMSTLEVRGVTMRLGSPRTRVLDVEGRIPNPAFAVAEAVWILSGSDAPWIYSYNEQLRRYADEDVLHGAYGPRIRRWGGRIDQLAMVRQLLSEQPDSRQAVVQIFDPARDWSGAKDIPCTIGHRFLVRAGALHMHTSMRSQDVWLGFPYDVFSATVMQEVMAGWLGVQVGEYVNHVDSLHIYQRDSEAACAVSQTSATVHAELDGELRTDYDQLDRTLAAVLDGQVQDLPEGWRSYAAVLASYRHWKQGHRADALALAETVSGPLHDAMLRWYAYLEDRQRAPGRQQ